MKKYVPVVIIVVLASVSCMPLYRVYNVEKYADYDTIRGVFVYKENDTLKDARLFIGPEDYIYYSPARKMYIKRLSQPSMYDQSRYSYVLYMGHRCRLIEYADDGYYGQGCRTYMIYDLEDSRVVVSFSLGDTAAWNKVRKEDVQDILSDTVIIYQRDMKPSKGKTPRAERQYLLHRGYDY
jgi:hypothetical protein